ncbi:MAG: glycosyltransferase [Pirellulales bacterium]
MKPHSHKLAPARDVAIVVPCFNEARRLKVSAFSAFLNTHPNITLTLIDDGSTDDTPLILECLRQQHPAQICTLRLEANVGKAEAVRLGVLAALRRGPQFVGYWDADLATPLAAIASFVDILLAQPNLQLVMGSRVSLLGRKIRRPIRRHIMGRAFATAASLVLNLPVYDTQCGAKLFRATAQTAELFAQPFRTRWIFDVELLARIKSRTTNAESALPADDSIYEFPLEQWEDVAGSRLKSHDIVTAALDLLRVYWQYMRHNDLPDRHASWPATSPAITPLRKAA